MPVEILRSAAKCVPMRVALRPGFPNPGCGRLQSRESQARTPLQPVLPYLFLRVPHREGGEPCRFSTPCVQIASECASGAPLPTPRFAQPQERGFRRRIGRDPKKKAHSAPHCEPIHEPLLQEAGAGEELVGKNAAAEVAVEGVAPQRLDRECAGREGDIG
jgi:hypothetical protein